MVHDINYRGKQVIRLRVGEVGATCSEYKMQLCGSQRPTTSYNCVVVLARCHCHIRKKCLLFSLERERADNTRQVVQSKTGSHTNMIVACDATTVSNRR